MAKWISTTMLGVTIVTMAAGATTAQEVEALSPTEAEAPIYDPPGYYGMAWGVPSFGVPRLSSRFATPFGGVGYGYGLAPYSYLPGPHGAGLWRPGFVEPGYFHARGMYRTFPIPRGAIQPAPGVPVGYYAPSLGPPIFPRP